MSEIPDKPEKRCGTCLAYLRQSGDVARCQDATSVTFGSAMHECHIGCRVWRPKWPLKAVIPSNPYSRTITKWAWVDDTRKLVSIEVDWYDIATAYGLSHPLAHAGKKLIDRGTGEKSRTQELREAIASIERAIEMEGKA